MGANWAIGGNFIDQEYAFNMAAFRVARRLPPVDGSVDAYPSAQRSILANHLNFDPRPFFQSHVAYTWEIGQINADFLRGPHAPDSILLDFNPIDLHYPALEDSASWPELLTRYDAADASKSMLLLRRAAQPRSYSLVPLISREVPLNQWIELPESDDPIWAQIEVRLTSLGKVREALYKPLDIRMRIVTPYGIKDYRLVREIARGGFLLSPFIIHRLQFAYLQSPTWKQHLSGDIATRLQVFVKSDTAHNGAYESSYGLRLFGLHYPHQTLVHVPGLLGKPLE